MLKQIRNFLISIIDAINSKLGEGDNYIDINKFNNLIEEKNTLNSKIIDLENKNNLLNSENAILATRILDDEEELKELKKKELDRLQVSEEEIYINNKWTKSDITYKAEGNYSHDVRNYLFEQSAILRDVVLSNNLIGIDDDDTVYRCEQYVNSKLKYKYDSEQYGEKEYWQNPENTLQRGLGDCFTGDTKILVEKQGIVSLKSFNELKTSWKEYNVISYNFDTKKSVIKPITNFMEKGTKPVFEVGFSGNYKFKCTDNHKFYCQQTQDCKFDWTELKNIDVERSWKRQLLAIRKIPEGKITIKEDLANLIGSYVADGWINKNKIAIASDNVERTKKLHEALTRLGIKYSQSKRKIHAYTNILKTDTPPEYFELLNSCGKVGKEKRFPEFIMGLNNEGIKLILKYYGDRDATHKEGLVEVYSTISSILSEQIKLLLRRQGIHYSSHIQIQDRPDCHREPIHRIYVRDEGSVVNDYCEKKSVKSIEFVGVEETFDITVKDTHNFVLENGVIAHNCEDFTILIKSLTLVAGVPDYKVKVCAGDVKTSNGGVGGHCYGIYLRNTDKEWVTIEGSYYPTKQKISLRPLHKENVRYGNIWFTFNKKFTFAQNSVELVGRAKNNYGL